jgi:AcrR family transcriptional regulator
VADQLLRRLEALRVRCEKDLRRLIASAAAAGFTAQEIADAIGVSRATLWRRYREDLQRHR